MADDQFGIMSPHVAETYFRVHSLLDSAQVHAFRHSPSCPGVYPYPEHLLTAVLYAFNISLKVIDLDTRLDTTGVNDRSQENMQINGSSGPPQRAEAALDLGGAWQPPVARGAACVTLGSGVGEASARSAAAGRPAQATDRPTDH